MPANDKVVLAEVNCRESRELMQKHQAGAGGWPTLKYFNKETGLAGAKYAQKTQQRVCDEGSFDVAPPSATSPIFAFCSSSSK